MTPETPEYCLFYSAQWWLCMNKAEWSGWIQALGSVLAIAIAGGIAAYQINAARKQALEMERRQLYRRYNVVKAIAIDAREVIRRVVDEATVPRTPEEWLDTGYELLLASSMKELEFAQTLLGESHTLVRAVRALVVGVAGAQKVLSRLAAGKMTHDSDSARGAKILLTAADMSVWAIGEAADELSQDPTDIDTERLIKPRPQAAPPVPSAR